MLTLEDQFKTEFTKVRQALANAGYDIDNIEVRLQNLQIKEPEKFDLRNSTIKEVGKILRGPHGGYKPYFVDEILSKITGLSPRYLTAIVGAVDPVSISRLRKHTA